MFISKLHLFSKAKTTQVKREIALKTFLDLYFDTVGWYAFGHHEPKAFLAAVVKQQPYTKFSTTQVRLTWAKFEGNEFEISEVPISGFQAITLLEDWGCSD